MVEIPDDVSLERPDYKWLLTNYTLPFSPPPLPPRSGAPPPSHTSSLITVLFVALHSVIQGRFVKTSFDINIGITLSSIFPFGMTFRTFMQHFFA